VGLYLVWHFLGLVPYGGEIFSNQGILPEASLNFSYPFFPNLLYFFDSSGFVIFFLSFMVFLSFVLLTGFKRKWVAFFLWYGYACLFNRNNLINNPSLAFVGWVLLAFACLPKEDDDWYMPQELFYGAWFIMGASYSISGIHKLGSPGWADGEAFRFLLENPLSRDYFLKDWLLLLPEWMIKLQTWGILALEIGFLPLCFFPLGRLVVWFLMVGMHLGILMVVNFPDLTLGVLVMHVFTFDPRWLKKFKLATSKKT